MASGFGIRFPEANFSWLGQLPSVYMEARDEGALREALKDPDILSQDTEASRAALQRLIAAGPKSAEWARKFLETREQAAHRAGTLDVARGHLGVSRSGEARAGRKETREIEADVELQKDIRRLYGEPGAPAPAPRARSEDEPTIYTPGSEAVKSRFWPGEGVPAAVPGPRSEAPGGDVSSAERLVSAEPIGGAPPSMMQPTGAPAQSIAREALGGLLSSPDAASIMRGQQAKALGVSDTFQRPAETPILERRPPGPRAEAEGGIDISAAERLRTVAPPSAKEQEYERLSKIYELQSLRQGLSPQAATAARAIATRYDQDRRALQQQRFKEGEERFKSKEQIGQEHAKSDIRVTEKMHEKAIEKVAANTTLGSKVDALQLLVNNPMYFGGRTGQGVEFVTAALNNIADVAKGYGIDIPAKEFRDKYIRDPAKVHELASSIMKQIVIGQVTTLGGNFSNTDRSYQELSNASPLQTKQTAQALVAMVKANIQRQEDAAEIIAEGRTMGKNSAQIQRRLREYADENPLYMLKDGSLTELGKTLAGPLGITEAVAKKAPAGAATAAPAPAGRPAPTPEALRMLQGNPALKDRFIEFYGQEAFDRAFGG